MLQSVVSVSIQSPLYDHPGNEDDGGHHLRVDVGTVPSYLGARNGDGRLTAANCSFPPGECSRCGSRSRSASPRSMGGLASREASPFTYTTRILHRRGTPCRRRRRRTSTKVRQRKTEPVCGEVAQNLGKQAGRRGHSSPQIADFRNMVSQSKGIIFLIFI